MLPIKTFQFIWGWPISLLSDDSSIIEREDIGAVLKTFDKKGYKIACQKINNLLDSDRELLRIKIRHLANKYRNFDVADKVYSQIYR